MLILESETSLMPLSCTQTLPVCFCGNEFTLSASSKFSSDFLALLSGRTNDYDIISYYSLTFSLS